MENPQFLKRKYNNLHTSPEVASATNRTEKQTGEKISQSPEKQIQNYLDRFSEILNREDTEERQQGIEALKKVLHKNLIIKEENIPLDYFIEQEQGIAEQRGHGRPEATPHWKKQKTKEILQGQERSLDKWIDYLSFPNAMYPDWAKYWAFRSMTQMGGYSKKEGKFGKRTEKSSQPFPTLNIACMAKTIDLVQRNVEITGLPKDDPERLKKEKELSYALNHDSEYKELLSTENFSKLYTHALEKFSGMSWESLENIAGQWKTYEQGSEPDELYDSLQGYPLEWCTATNIETARDQLEGGDFHVYYSQNKDGISTIPRIAILMEHDSIAEIRGIEKEQNMDAYINPVLDEKLHEFGSEGESYLKKSEDMKRMTEVTEKHRAGQELNKDDLRFIHQLDGRIEGFGYEEDSRINEVRENRDWKDDMFIIFEVNDDNSLARSMVIEDLKHKLRGKLEKFNELDSNICFDLLGPTGHDNYNVLRNLKIFKDVSHLQVLKKLIDLNRFEDIISNMDCFDSSINHNDIVSYSIENGKSGYISSNLDKFNGIDHKELAFKLIKSGHSYSVVDDLKKFNGVDHNEIALAIIEFSGYEPLYKKLSNFENLNSEIGLKIIQNSIGSNVIKSIESFKLTDRFLLLKKEIELGTIKSYFDNKEKFNFLDEDQKREITSMSRNEFDRITKDVVRFNKILNFFALNLRNEKFLKFLSDNYIDPRPTTKLSKSDSLKIKEYLDSIKFWAND